MKLVDALKRKKMLVGEINDFRDKIQQHNNWLTSECAQIPALSSQREPEFKADEVLTKYQDAKKKLVKLKTAIFTANKDIQHLIVELGEVKDEISLLQSLDCNEVRNPRVDRGYIGRQDLASAEPLVIIETRHTAISAAVRDTRVKALEERILEIESELNNHNFVTVIEV